MDVVADGWRVTSQAHIESYTPNGSFEKMVKVAFITDNGTPGSMDFPEAKYNAATVAAAINEFVQRERAVAALGNGKA